MNASAGESLDALELASLELEINKLIWTLKLIQVRKNTDT